jgi:hypothetical protein
VSSVSLHVPQRFFTSSFVQEEEEEDTESSYSSGRVEGGGGAGLSVPPHPQPRENMIHVVGVKNDRTGPTAHNQQVTVMKVGTAVLPHPTHSGRT